MGTERLTALTGGVMAVIITIMVLEMKAPGEASLTALASLWPVFLSYVISFLYVAIYWNNHHHFFSLAPRVTGAILWSNFHLLFWLSLLPLATAWMGAHPFAPAPTAVYGLCLLSCALAWSVMQQTLLLAEGPSSRLRRALGRDLKGKLSPVLYALAVPLAFVWPALADLIYAGVALMWIVPDRRVEAAHQERA